MKRLMHSMGNALRIRNPLVRAALAEFLGSCLLIVIGDGSVAQSVLSSSTKGEFLSINWSWCMAVIIGVLVSINASGGHINPAVSLAMALIGRLQWKRLVIYALSQYLGAFVGAAIVLLVYYDALEAFDGGVRVTDPTNRSATAGIFSTYPQDFLSTTRGFVDQVVGTAILLVAVMAITDKRNANVPKFFVPFLVGLTVFAIGAAYGFNCGYAINPARDLGPRILTAVAGWGDSVFTFRNYNWFWVPVVGPHVGAILAVFIYLLFIEFHWPEDQNEVETTDSQADGSQGGKANQSYVEEEPEVVAANN